MLRTGPVALSKAVAMATTEQTRLIGNLIFLSYRRADTATSTLALRLELQTHLQAAQIFVDTHTIQSGDAWPHQIDDALRLAKVIIPVIGKAWAGGDETGKRRIDDPRIGSTGSWRSRWNRSAALSCRCWSTAPVGFGKRNCPNRCASLPISSRSRSISTNGTTISIRSFRSSRTGSDSSPKTQNVKYPEPDPLKWKTMAVPWDVLETEVAQRLPSWRIEISDDVDNMHYKRVELVRDFEFESFEKAMSFIDTVAKHATEIDHHPRWMNLWRTVSVWLSTWDAGRRITALDIQLARYLERKYKEF